METVGLADAIAAFRAVLMSWKLLTVWPLIERCKKLQLTHPGTVNRHVRMNDTV